MLGDAEAELRAALAEHTGWLARNNERQLTAYEEAVRSRGFDPALTDLNLGDVIAADGAEEAAEVEAAMAEAAVQTEAEAVRAETVQTETESEADSDEAATPSSPSDGSSSAFGVRGFRRGSGAQTFLRGCLAARRRRRV